jgi:hypothetical protein
MDTLPLIILIAFVAGIAVSWSRPSCEPQIIYYDEVQTGSCGLPHDRG